MPAEPNPELAFIEMMLSGGTRYHHCTGRLVATGYVQRMQEFIHAEMERGTSPLELLVSIASTQGGTLAAIMCAAFKPESRLAATDHFMDVFVKQIRATVIAAGGEGL
ncbi:hypothetical protein EN875_032295 [Mesorhizobium sp. M2D.F.Ca.ET.232.01.1.1]|uniref:hypothetical protein n=1 Tax=Mesorhizobium sp. M2D.F.Ca.ET.232.01.1.1 TaxID=2496670 RepID=UPI000FCB1C26|nr:hypothetical protein [Mesorhizobium sp. M2D.F.Ca.ET.232.01.1.1]TGP28239.1 hypothetical protein EN875_032295 [Mesorhizobium sp. M2D.F.Ca.ET.232.01.1.1]